MPQLNHAVKTVAMSLDGPHMPMKASPDKGRWEGGAGHGWDDFIVQ